MRTASDLAETERVYQMLQRARSGNMNAEGSEQAYMRALAIGDTQHVDRAKNELVKAVHRKLIFLRSAMQTELRDAGKPELL